MSDVLACASCAVMGPPPKAERFAEGRHAASGDGTGFGVAFVEAGGGMPRIVLSTFGSHGEPAAVRADLAGTALVPLFAAPSVASLPGGRAAVVWTDLGTDGDGLGIAARVLAPSDAAPSTKPVIINTTNDFGQHEPDVVWTGSQLVVAWVDESDPDTAPDIRVRVLNDALEGAPETALAVTADAEAGVTLAVAGDTWIAAWRASSGGEEWIRAAWQGQTWSLGPVVAGPAEDRPGVAELDSEHLLLAYSVGLDPDGDGFADRYAVRIAALDTTTGTSVVVALPAQGGGDPLSQSQPALVTAGGRRYVAWRTGAALGDAAGDDVWIAEVSWQAPASLGLGTPIALPRAAGHRVGDQRRPSLGAAPLSFDGAILAVWTDLGGGMPGSAKADVVVQFLPAPIVRLSP